jgi:dinuclear metal center YbgI/SA1388 family protein
MIELAELVQYCNDRLDIESFDDYCPNGLQIEGRSPVEHVVSGVTASLALIDAAIAVGADALLVHHGYFWRAEPAPLVGVKGRRVRRLMQNRLSLLAYHLPLDVHPDLGNNQRLAVRLGLLEARPASPDGLIWRGRLPTPTRPAQFAALLEQRLDRAPLHVAAEVPTIERLTWCTGAAQGFIDRAADLGCDAYLSGEISEPTVHSARELGLHYFAAGHHATERYGIQALGAEVAKRFAIRHEFIEIANPV